MTLCGAHRRLVESSLPQGRARCRPAGSHGLPEQRNVCAGTKLEVPTLPGQALSALDKNAASQARPRNCRFRRSGWGPGVCVCGKPPGALVTCRAALPGTMSSASPGEGQSAVCGLFSRPRGSPQAGACRPCVPGYSSWRGSAGERVLPFYLPSPRQPGPKAYVGRCKRKAELSLRVLGPPAGLCRCHCDLPGPHRHRHQLSPQTLCPQVGPGPTLEVAPAAELGPCPCGGCEGALTCGETLMWASADFRLQSPC